MAEISITDLTEDAEENKMEITRNPFDSNLCDKDNYPGLDASVFVQSTTPEKENAEFRWSIGQIALMNPAVLDLNPNQEYSISYDKKEDEIREQEEVNEYFQNVLLPSPWLDDNGEVLKRVTFSPHPPTMRYIQDTINNSDSCDGSIEPVVKEDVEKKEVTVPKQTTMSDACCQTRISIPMNFDFEALLDKQFCSYTEVSGEGKELMVSTLRRKLFDQEKNDYITSPALSQRNSCITSSPRKLVVSSADSSTRSILDSPSISPVRRVSSGSSMSVFNSSCDFSPKHASNVGSPHFVRNIEMSLSSVDVSPIGSCEKKYIDCDNYSFMPEVSFDVNESDGVKESSRAIRFGSPDVSPIQNLKKANSMLGLSTVMDSMEIPEAGVLSIKESTARNIHTFSGIDISSIGNGTNGKDGENKQAWSSLTYQGKGIKQEDNDNVTEDADLLVKENIVEDDGPLDITELTPNEDELNSGNSANCNYSFTDESANQNELTISDGETCGDNVKLLNANTPETVVNNTINAVNKRDECNSNDMGTPVMTMKMLQQHNPTQDSTSPLKGILKHSDSVTPTRPLSENTTHYNTICNSGKKRPIPKFYTDVDTPSGQYDSLPKPSLINRSLSDEFNLEADLDFHFRCDKFKVIDHLATHDGLISLRANSVLRRATNVVKRCEREHGGKENVTPTGTFEEHYRSIEDNGNEQLSSDNIRKRSERELLSSDVYVDSGIGSMEWCSEIHKDESNKVSPNSGCTSITPLMHLNTLNITDRVPWSARKVLCDSGKYSNILNRYAATRPHTWLNKSRSVTATPKSVIPRSRVTPSRCRSEMTTLKRMQSDYQYGRGSVLSAYKDLLPSPLK